MHDVYFSVDYEKILYSKWHLCFKPVRDGRLNVFSFFCNF